MIHIPIIRDAFEIYAKQYKTLGDYSVTTLIDSPRRVALFKRYGDQVDKSPESMAASIIGTGLHEKLEELLRLASVKHNNYMIERSVVVPVTVEHEGQKVVRLVAGRFDVLYEERDLFDLKTCKVWKLIFDPDMVEWHQQQNIYAWLLKQRGINVRTINIVAFYLDWLESQARRGGTYPQSPIVYYNLDLWPEEKQYEYMMSRLQDHVSCENVEDDLLPFCTDEEMWESKPEIALFQKPNQAKATKLYKKARLSDVLEEVTTNMPIGPESYLEIRHDVRKKCEGFCSINTFCNQYREYEASKKNGQRVDIFPLRDVI